MLKYPGNAAYTDDKGQLRDPNDLYSWGIGGEYTNGTNILGLVFFAGILNLFLRAKHALILI